MASYFWGPRVHVSGLSAAQGTFDEARASAATLQDDAGCDIVLLAGDDNMVGNAYGGSGSADVTEYGDPARLLQLPPGARSPVPALDPLAHPGAPALDTTGASIGMEFGRLHAKASGRTVVLVPVAASGTGFRDVGATLTTSADEVAKADWLAGDSTNLVAYAASRANVAMAYHPVHNPLPTADGPPHPANRFAGILWHQGVSDVGMRADVYKDLLAATVSRLRTSIAGASDATPFISGLPAANAQVYFPDNGPAAVVPRIADVAYFGQPACVPVGVPLDDGAAEFVTNTFTDAQLLELGRRYYAAFVTGAPTIPAVTTRPLDSSLLVRFEFETFFDPPSLGLSDATTPPRTTLRVGGQAFAVGSPEAVADPTRGTVIRTTNGYLKSGVQPASYILSKAMWVFPLSVAGTMHLMSGDPAQPDVFNDAARNRLHLMYIVDGQLHYAYRSQLLQTVPMGVTISTNTWTHLAITHSIAQVVLYVNGSPAASFVPQVAIVTTNLMNTSIGGYDGAQRFDGYIDDARLYGRALSTTEVARLAAYG
jgi:hypothetical protein